MKIHPAAELFPLMYGEEYDALVEDIRANGLREPGKTVDGLLIDGRNRQRACEVAGVEFVTVPIDLNGDDPVAYVVSLNVKRRKLTLAATAVAAARAWDMVAGAKGKRARNLARVFGVNSDYITHARALVDRDPDAAESVWQGTTKLSDAYDALRARERDLRSAEASLDGLRSRHPDLAELVTAESLGLREALAAGRERDEREREERETRTRVLVALVQAGKPPEHAARYAEIYDAGFDDLGVVTSDALREVAAFAVAVATELEGKASE